MSISPEYKYEQIDALNLEIVNNDEARFNDSHINDIITFDIETSTAYKIGGEWLAYNEDDPELLTNPDKYTNAEKCSFLYIWQLTIKTRDTAKTFLGRTWEDFTEAMKHLTANVRCHVETGSNLAHLPKAARLFYMSDKWQRKNKPKIHMWIHNLSYEFHFLRNLPNKFSVFARQAHKPMKATTTFFGVPCVLHDTLCLTHMSLKQWGRAEMWSIQKQDEPTSYYLPIRTPATDLTDRDISYSVNDTESLACGVFNFREKFGAIYKIPMTQTGITRRQYVPMLQGLGDWMGNVMDISATISREYMEFLFATFTGGWTHANPTYTGRIIERLLCFDLSSSYPAVMCYRTFPVTKFEDCSPEEFDSLSKQNPEKCKYHWCAQIKFHNFESVTQNNYLSNSPKIKGIKGVIADNGKIKSAAEFTAYVTDLDFYILSKSAIWDRAEVLRLRKATAGRLPREFVIFIIEKYNHKTTMKNQTGKEAQYAEAKQFINGIYGCSVTNIFKDEVKFVEKWETTPLTDEQFDDILLREFKNKTPLPYQIGVWVTAWARFALWWPILRLDDLVVYCDTDSVKAVYNERVFSVIRAYNLHIQEMMKETSDYLGVDYKIFFPKDPDGVSRALGIFSREEDAINFKTLGAKRYTYAYDKNQFNKGKSEVIAQHVTVAGLPTLAGSEQIHSAEDFVDGKVWTAKESHKLTTYYNENQPDIIVKDLNGKPFHVKGQKFGISLVPTTYSLKMSDEYIQFVEFIQKGLAYERQTPTSSNLFASLFKGA